MYYVIGLLVLVIILILYLYSSKSSFSYTKGYTNSLTGAQAIYYDVQAQIVSVQDWCFSISRLYNATNTLFALGDFSADVKDVTSILMLGSNSVVYPVDSTDTSNVFHGTMNTTNYSGDAGQHDADLLWSMVGAIGKTTSGSYSTSAGTNCADIVLDNFYGVPGSSTDVFSPVLSLSAATFTSITSPVLKNAAFFPNTLYSILWNSSYATLKSFCADIVRANSYMQGSQTSVPTPTTGSMNTIYLMNAYYSVLASSVRTANTVQFIYSMKDIILAAALFMNYDALLFTNGCENVKSFADFVIYSKLLALSPQNAAYNNISNYVDYNGYSQAMLSAVGLDTQPSNTTGSGPFSGLSPLLTTALRIRNSIATLLNYANAHWHISHLCNAVLNQNFSMTGNTIVTDGNLYYTPYQAPTSTPAPLYSASAAGNNSILNSMATFSIYTTSPYNVPNNANDGSNFSGSAQGGNLIGNIINSYISVPVMQYCIAALNSINTGSTDQQVKQAMSNITVLLGIMPRIMHDISATIIFSQSTYYWRWRYMLMSIVNDILSAPASASAQWSSSIGFVSPTGSTTPGSPLTWTGPNSQVPVVPCANIDAMLQAVTSITPPSLSPDPFMNPAYTPVSSFISALIVQNSKTNVLPSNLSVAFNSLFALGGFILYAETELFGKYPAVPSNTDFFTSPCNELSFKILDLIAMYNSIVD